MPVPNEDVVNCRPVDEAIRNRELSLFEILLDGAPFAAFIYKGDRFCCYVNRSAELLTGYSGTELFSMNYWDIAHPDYKELVKKRGRLRQTGENVPSSYEIKIVTRGGEERWVDLNATMICLDGDRYVFLTAIDVSDRKRFEEYLRLAQFSVETSADAIFWITSEGKFYNVNKSACKEQGYTPDELLRLYVWDIDPLYTKEKWLDEWSYLKKNKSHKFETLHKTKEGKLIPVEIQANYMKYDNVEYSCAFSRDLTERKRIEEYLKITQLAMDKFGDPIIWLSSDGRLVYVNEAASRSLGYSKEELLSMYVWDIDPLFPPERYLKDWREEYRRRGFLKFDTIHRARDGRRFPVDVTASYIKYEDKEFLITFDKDITLRKKVEKELKDAKDQAELYLDLMGHDINNFNQVALGYLELADETIKSSGKLGENDRMLIDKPIAALKDSSKLIDNVRKLQKIRTKELRLNLVDICDVLLKMKEHYQHFGGRDISINYIRPAECMVVANELIEEIFRNLVENSIKHSSPDKPLVIDIIQSKVCEDGKEYNRISVEDNGPGIPDEVKEKLFRRFYRGHTKAGGKGLGLYMVKTLVEDFNGKVWVEDRVPGDYTKGAKFVVMIPVAEQ
jgi:PAS domain S-box-containing protein